MFKKTPSLNLLGGSGSLKMFKKRIYIRHLFTMIDDYNISKDELDSIISENKRNNIDCYRYYSLIFNYFLDFPRYLVVVSV